MNFDQLFSAAKVDQPNQILFIGDSFTNDICGAQFAGMQSALVIRNLESEDIPTQKTNCYN